MGDTQAVGPPRVVAAASQAYRRWRILEAAEVFHRGGDGGSVQAVAIQAGWGRQHRRLAGTINVVKVLLLWLLPPPPP